MNVNEHYRLAAGVAVRDERFGGLIYHYDNRQLYFLHSHDITALIGSLTGEWPLRVELDRFCARCDVASDAGEAMIATLASLAKLGVIVSVDGNGSDDHRPRAVEDAGPAPL